MDDLQAASSMAHAFLYFGANLFRLAIFTLVILSAVVKVI
jgi:hypothetical protein